MPKKAGMEKWKKKRRQEYLEMKEAENEYEAFKQANQLRIINIAGRVYDVFIIWMRNSETGW